MALEELDDAIEQCTWVESGVRCENPPVKGNPTSSCCAEHCPAPVFPPPGG